jgi:dienelactone hydrolase
MRSVTIAATSAILAVVSAAWGQSDAPTDARQQIRVPVRAHAPSGGTFTLQAFVYQPAGGGLHPLAVLSHGSSGGDPKLEVPEPELAQFFTDRGFVVVVPMRRGRGTSGGLSLEGENKDCDPASWWPGLHAAYDDVTATIDAAVQMPGVDARRVLLVGESRGGFLSVAYAAQGARRAQVAGVVNFVGGWVAQAEDNCPVDFNQVAFRRFGQTTPVPELWLYGDHDRFYATSSIRSYSKAFAKRGGKVTFDLIDGVPGNGHWLPGFPALWTASINRYLAMRSLLTFSILQPAIPDEPKT